MPDPDGDDDSDADETDGDAPEDTMRGRVPGSRVKLWLLLGANRWAVAAVLLAGVFALLVALGALDVVPLRKGMSQKDPVETTFQALLTALITGVTLVVSINQVVLSQELGAVGDQRERMAGAMEFRTDVESAVDAPVSPPEPASFLRALLDAANARARAVTDALGEEVDDSVRGRVTAFVDDLTGNADAVSDQLDGAQFGTFEVLYRALNFNYSWKIYQARRLRAQHADELDEATRDAIDDLVDILRFFGPAREHFKTLYFQWELINLSRAMLYTALPALVVTTATMLYLDTPGDITGATLAVDNLVWVVAAAVTVSIVPFMLLVAYVLRIATVAKRTLAIGPFVLRETTRDDAIDWDTGDGG